MTQLDQSMVKKGAVNSTGVVLGQGERALGNITTYFEPLCKAGLSPDTPELLKKLLADVRAKSSARAEGREESNHAGLNEAAERSNAKGFIRRAKTTSKIVLKKGPVKGVSLAAFDIGPAGRSSTELIVQLADLRPHVLILDEDFKNYFEQKSAVTVLDQISANLSELAGLQDAKRDSLPLETLGLYEARGRVIDLVEHINLVASIAFDGQAEIRGLFNKDMLLREKRGSRRKAGTEQQPTETPEITTKPA